MLDLKIQIKETRELLNSKLKNFAYIEKRSYSEDYILELSQQLNILITEYWMLYDCYIE
ncbi:hypothetical protein SAMN02745945_00123 [Peptoclostridium litorale DSM 5388]|uniref:Spo0E like sporulation regulatory protein n=1 Tax=Peptoclostridium litorale DSM 5388 TaxID=1121324 RepID=A0A069RR43_PEPLI|nr:hypothetical protein CLIT_2c02330 [Peptoclostridium litorale DSM 5388]SIN68309.1 hypothetical protein SAMN02745945_00123 [Peptoclostridium litorale DSM 5388]